MTEVRAIRWRFVAGFVGGLLVGGVAVLAATVIASRPRDASFPKREVPSLQYFAERLSYTEGQDAQRQALLPYDEISLERTGCYGSCPVFHVSFRRDGTGNLKAGSFMPAQGRFVTRIDDRTFVRLTQLALLARIETMSPSFAGTWTDDATAIVRVRRGSNVYQVSDYGEVGPPELWALAQAIDATRSRALWSTAR